MVTTFLTSKLACLFLATIASIEADATGSDHHHSLLRGDPPRDQRYLFNNGNHGGGNTHYPIYNRPGSDRDDYGCIGSAGYSWCHSLSKCIRPWETTCPGGGGGGDGGGDVDIHGCRASAGYTFCAYTRQCERPGDCNDGLVCGTVYQPVTCGGSDYSNLCEAQREGYKAYQCTSVEVIYDDCDAVYEPVQCGRRGKRYANVCEAERDGFYPRQCTSIGGGSGPGGGIGCDRTYRPVICDGYYTYNNLCLAEAEGFNQNNCVDDHGGGGGDVFCPAVYQPVYCDGNKYSNVCEAGKDGYSEWECSDGHGGHHDDPINPYCPAYCSAELAKGNCYGVAQAW
eukprot:CAMPEP_0170847356 /NCGR_PEP_ID=MMETSP0734-20130129/8735_1 /TAXON_ID=186038 /ORGANISM="Fragilariopsis kerguelensis, Strain L26-C5" /LENGTH=339 /DNA_ID=CAMNT_0011216561 /DNA_START=95 /DNA_END=1111 /DNA_ORIENTATION=-